MNIVYLGIDGFPHGFAQIQKQKMISKALVLNQTSVTIICAKGINNKEKIKNFPYKGSVEGIAYIYSSLTAYRPDSFAIRSIFKLIGRVNEFILILLLRQKNLKNIAIISTKNIYLLRYYHTILHLFGYKVILSYEEFVSSLPPQSVIEKTKPSFDSRAYKYCDGLLPISSYLDESIKSLDKNAKTMKIPVLTDFDFIDSIVFEGEKDTSILFCGSSAYFENICFVIDSFEFVSDLDIKLILVIHGNQLQNARISNYIAEKSTKIDRISVLSNLPYEKLVRLYKKSSVLLIPLKPNKRDLARFPHKIAEYTASYTPILTTAVGEINQYFADNINAFIVNTYDRSIYGDRINSIFEDSSQSLRVANNAYELGRSNFHFKSISDNLVEFLVEV